MAFYYHQGNRIEQVEKGEALSSKPEARNQHPLPFVPKLVEEELIYRQVSNTSNSKNYNNNENDSTTAAGGTSASNRRRERLADALHASTRQGELTNHDQKLSKFFGEPIYVSTEKARMTARRRNKFHFYLADMYDPSDLLFNSQGRVSYGTWRGLILHLTRVQGDVEDFAQTFFLTFRSFARPRDLAEALVARARIQPPEQMSSLDMKLWQYKVQAPVQHKVFLAIQFWYNNYWQRKLDDCCLAYMCSYLINEYLPTRHGWAARECQKFLQNVEDGSDQIDLKSLTISSKNTATPAPISRVATNATHHHHTNQSLENTAQTRTQYTEHVRVSTVNSNQRRYTLDTNDTRRSNYADSNTNPHSMTAGHQQRYSNNSQPSENDTFETDGFRNDANEGSDNYNSDSGKYARKQNHTGFFQKLFSRKKSNSETPTRAHPSPKSSRSHPHLPNLPGHRRSNFYGYPGSIASNDSGDERHGPMGTIARQEGYRRASNPEEPDLSELLMATVGVDLSIEGYRGISHIIQVSPIDVACQLTIIESSCFCQIEPSELLNKEFSRGEEANAKNVRQMTRWCTQITRWATSVILSEVTPERRCRMLKYFIQLGMQLLALKNYDAVMAVKAAIFCASVMRLKKTWALLPKKFDILCKKLLDAMDPDRNYANYREILRHSQPPLLPFLGLYLTDLTFLEDGNPTYRRCDAPSDQLQQQQQQQQQHNAENTHDNTVQLTGQTCALFAERNEVDLNSMSIMINFEKSYKVAAIIAEIQKFQIEYSGNFTIAVPGLQQFLIEQWDKCEAEGYDDDTLYRMSLEVEPRVAAYAELDRANTVQQSMHSSTRLTRLLPGATKLMSKDASGNSESARPE